MTGEKENREYYKNTFDEVHASDHLLRKVEAMGKEYNKKKSTRILRRSCVAAATLALALISSNIICYAATGSSWFITVTTWDGKELPSEPGTYELEDGTVYTVKDLVEEAGDAVSEDAASKDIEIEASSDQEIVDLLEESREGEEGNVIPYPSSDSYVLEVPQRDK